MSGHFQLLRRVSETWQLSLHHWWGAGEEFVLTLGIQTR